MIDAHCLRHEDTVSTPGRQHQFDPAVRERRGRRLRRRHCATVVSDVAAMFAADGRSPIAVFANPHGRVFEVVTVLHADNLLFASGSTTDFTWFPGYAWRVALCARCLAHLGWSFVGARSDVSPATFFGLLRADLVEEEDRTS